MNNIIKGQAIVKHETPHDSTISISNPKIRAEINYRLGNEFNEIILSPVIGVQKVRKVLIRYGLDIPALYELDYEGDEIVLEMDQFGKIKDQYDSNIHSELDQDEDGFYLYLLYFLNDDGSYEFYAELTNKEGIDRIMEEDEELEKNV